MYSHCLWVLILIMSSIKINNFACVPEIIFFITAIRNFIFFPIKIIRNQINAEIHIYQISVSWIKNSYLYHWNASVCQWEFLKIFFILFFIIIFGHSWKTLLCESFCGPDLLLVQVVGFTGEAYYRHNMLDTFRKKVTDSYCCTNIIHKNFTQFYISMYSVHI